MAGCIPINQCHPRIGSPCLKNTPPISYTGEENLEQCLRDWDEISKLVTSEAEERECAQKVRQTKVALKRAKRKDFYKVRRELV